MLRQSTVALFILIGLCGATRAGDLGAIRARKAAAKLKLETEVKEGLEDSRKLTAEGARLLLRMLLREVKDSPYLQEAERQALVRSLEERLAHIHEPLPALKIWEPAPPPRPIVRPRLRPPLEPLQDGPPFVLLKMLNSILSVDYDDISFQDALDNLDKRTGLTLTFEAESARDVKLDRDKPLTLKTLKQSVRHALRQILAAQGLTYIIQGDELHVLTPARARTHMLIRSYDIADLVKTANQGLPPRFQDVQVQQKAKKLMALIQSGTDPDHWQPRGHGAITFDLKSLSIDVLASVEMHLQLAHPQRFSAVPGGQP